MEKVKRVNDQEHIQALIDKKKVIITEDSIRSDLRFDDAEGIVCLLNERKEAEISHDESKDEDHVPTPSSDPLPSGEDSYTLNELIVFCTSLKSRSGGLRRLMKIGLGRRVRSSLEKDSLGAQEDESKQGKMIEEIDQDDYIALDADTQGRKYDDEICGVDDLSREEVVLDTTTGEHKEQIIKDVSTAKPVNTAGEVVTIVDEKVSVAPTTDVTEDEITMAQALAALKSTKPKVVLQEQEVSTTIPSAATTVTTAVLNPRAKGIVFHEQKQSHIPTVSSSKDKGKAKMIEPKVPIKKKDQIKMDEEYAKQLEVEEQEVARLSFKQEKGKNSLRSRRQDWNELYEIKELFDREMRKVNNFIAMDSKAQKRSRKEAQESGTKITAESLESDISKKQKVDENVKLVINDTKKLKKCMEIVPDDGDEMFKNFNRENLEVLWGIVKDRFKKEKPMDDMDNLLFRCLKTMFEHHVEDVIWTYQKGLAKVNYNVEMAYDLLRFIKKQLMEGYIT
nr:hypothetical protein [Tanacetum cinerariifolium]